MDTEAVLKLVRWLSEYLSDDWALLKTPDDNKQNDWRRKPDFSHHYGDRCLFLFGSCPLNNLL